MLPTYKPLNCLFMISFIFFFGCEINPNKEKNVEISTTPNTDALRIISPSKADSLPYRPKIDLTKDILFKILVAEFAGQRANYDIAIDNYLELAKITNDPVVLERAILIALYANRYKESYEAAYAWISLDPDNVKAHHFMAVTSLANGYIKRSLFHLNFLHKTARAEFEQSITMISSFIYDKEKKYFVFELVDSLIERYKNDTNIYLIFSNVFFNVGKLDLAKKLLKEVPKLNPDEDAVIIYIALLKKMDLIKEALVWIKEGLKEDDKKTSLRKVYAYLLFDIENFKEAYTQFEILVKQEPDNINFIFLLGVSYLETGAIFDAEKTFIRINKMKNNKYEASYYLGLIYEEQKKFSKARLFYEEVKDKKKYFHAPIRSNLILAREGNIDKALENLRAMDKTPDNNLILIGAETEILIEAKKYEEAMSVFDREIKKNSHPDLLYSRAMLAEKINRLDILEDDLKTIIEQDQKNMVALNALGYTLADRTDRYEEALFYIQRAYELSSNNFYVLDSMGWIMYKLGRYEKALIFLRKAFSLKKDPEVALHLAEVLWSAGNKEEARDVLEKALKDKPKNKDILEAIKQFKL